MFGDDVTWRDLGSSGSFKTAYRLGALAIDTEDQSIRPSSKAKWRSRRNQLPSLPLRFPEKGHYADGVNVSGEIDTYIADIDTIRILQPLAPANNPKKETPAKLHRRQGYITPT